MSPHVVGLFLGYLAAVSAWYGARRLFPDLWPQTELHRFPRPWREVGLALLAGAAVVLLGQLWTRGIRLPTSGPAGPVLGSVNQLLIFSPFPVLLWLRRQPSETALLPTRHLGRRLLTGVGIAAVALAVHTAVRAAFGEDVYLVPRVLQWGYLDEAVQVLMEDVAIAILLVRLAAATGPRTTIAFVAVLFAAGHVPTMLAEGASAAELAGLARDVVLGVMVLGTVLKSRDIAWFWPVHLVMDLTQFGGVVGRL